MVTTGSHFVNLDPFSLRMRRPFDRTRIGSAPRTLFASPPIRSVLAGHMFNLLKHGAMDEDVNANCYRQIEELTAEAWLDSANQDLEEEDPEL